MDVLVNFSDLINKNRTDIDSWKAACTALNNMIRIYPECFSNKSDSFAPLRVHANVDSIEGVDTSKLETFLAKFLLVLDNEVHVEEVDYSGEQRFIEAGQQAAYMIGVSGGQLHDSHPEHNMELLKLKYLSSEIKHCFSQYELRLLYNGYQIEPEYLPRINMSVETLAEDLYIEFLVGGNRFTCFDISLALEGLKNSNPDGLDTLERAVREKCKNAIDEGVMTSDFLDREIDIWIKKNDLKKDHLGVIFDQYSPRKEKVQKTAACKSAKEEYKKINAACSKTASNKKKL